MVGRVGVGPTSSGFSDQRSDRLSYLPKVAHRKGFEPPIVALEGRCISFVLTVHYGIGSWDSNPDLTILEIVILPIKLNLYVAESIRTDQNSCFQERTA